MAIVFLFPAMDAAALASGPNGHWGLKSQEGADMKMESWSLMTEKIRKVMGEVKEDTVIGSILSDYIIGPWAPLEEHRHQISEHCFLNRLDNSILLIILHLHLTRHTV